MTRSQHGAADSVAAALRDVFTSPDYDWSQPPDPFARVRDWYLSLIDWLSVLQRTRPIAYILIMVVLTAVLLVILTHFAWTAWRAVQAARAAGPALAGAATGHDDAWHLDEARRHASGGRYRDAMGHRFIALILRLDRTGALRFHPSKTPAEYAREARLGARERGTLSGLVGFLYEHLFGGAPCTADAWRRFDSEAARLEGARAAA